MTSLYQEKINSENLIDYKQKNLLLHNTWIEINKEAIDHNLWSYKKIAKSALLMPVIKSNAYGHGITHIAKICDEHNAVDCMGVVCLSEALFLRSIGIKKNLIVLSIIDENLEQAVLNNIDLIIYNKETAFTLNEICKKLNKKINVHIKIDTGLSRLGVIAENAFSFIKEIYEMSFLVVKAIFTHFADSENKDLKFANQQLERFNSLWSKLQAEGIYIPLKHSSCSASLTRNLNNNDNLVRVGIGVYGLWPSSENKELTFVNYPDFYLKPALTWKAKILQIKDIPAGSYVGYDRTHQVLVPSRIAVIAVGYNEGYDRRLSNCGKVLINNQLASVIGRVAMNLTIIDVTNLSVESTDEVILLGNFPGITADDLAKYCGTINYEIVTCINPTVPRIIKN